MSLFPVFMGHLKLKLETLTVLLRLLWNVDGFAVIFVGEWAYIEVSPEVEYGIMSSNKGNILCEILLW